MQQKPTDELNDLLENMKPEQLDGYIKDNEKYLANNWNEFYFFFKDALCDKRIKLKDVYSFAGVSESYGGQVVRMEKPTRNRDLIIRLCLAGHFSLLEMNRALKLYGMPELYAKDPRDACIIVAVKNRIYDLYKMDEILKEHGLKELSVSE